MTTVGTPARAVSGATERERRDHPGVHVGDVEPSSDRMLAYPGIGPQVDRQLVRQRHREAVDHDPVGAVVVGGAAAAGAAGVVVITCTSCPAASWRLARSRTCISMPPSRGR